jgi:hypothetical protein
MEQRSRMRTKLVIGGLSAAVAFLLATNPVVVDAAGQIKSGQIKNETIKSKDIKNGQVSGADLMDASVGLTDLAPAVSAKLGSRGYVFELPKEPPANIQTYLLTGLPAGTYAFQYSVVAQMGGATQTFFCVMQAVAGTPPNLAEQNSTTVGGTGTASGGGILVKGDGPSSLGCSADLGQTMSISYDIGGPFPSTVTMIPLDSSSTTNVAP